MLLLSVVSAGFFVADARSAFFAADNAVDDVVDCDEGFTSGVLGGGLYFGFDAFPHLSGGAVDLGHDGVDPVVELTLAWFRTQLGVVDVDGSGVLLWSVFGSFDLFCSDCPVGVADGDGPPARHTGEGSRRGVDASWRPVSCGEGRCRRL